MSISVKRRIVARLKSQRRYALRDLQRSAHVLPQGWEVTMAAGWGLYVTAGEKTIMGAYDEMPKRLPRGVRDLLQACQIFMDAFGPGNERLTRGMKVSLNFRKLKG